MWSRPKVTGIVPTRTTCYQLLTDMEQYYHVSLSFWISIEKPPNSEIITSVHLVGSGDVFDVLDPGAGAVRARVLDCEGGNLYRAVWSALVQMESNIFRYSTNVKPSDVP